jgi:hypothetical protein
MARSMSATAPSKSLRPRIDLECAIGTHRGIFEAAGRKVQTARRQLDGDVVWEKIGGSREFGQRMWLVAHRQVRLSELFSHRTRLRLELRGDAIFDDGFERLPSFDVPIAASIVLAEELVFVLTARACRRAQYQECNQPLAR